MAAILLSHQPERFKVLQFLVCETIAGDRKDKRCLELSKVFGFQKVNICFSVYVHWFDLHD